jgi:ribosomal protein L35
MKTNKSYTKRIRVTKTGKLIARKPGQDHFNAGESGKKQLSKGRMQSLNVTTRIRRRFLSN